MGEEKPKETLREKKVEPIMAKPAGEKKGTVTLNFSKYVPKKEGKERR
jgi:hypothetical protein